MDWVGILERAGVFYLVVVAVLGPALAYAAWRYPKSDKRDKWNFRILEKQDRLELVIFPGYIVLLLAVVVHSIILFLSLIVTGNLLAWSTDMSLIAYVLALVFYIVYRTTIKVRDISPLR